MRRGYLARAVAMAAAGVLAAAGAPAFAEEEFCPMGGMLIKAEVDKDKALAWGSDRRKVQIANESSDGWSVLTLSASDRDIAILVQDGSVFFGIAGRGGEEVDDDAAERAFGRELRDLTDAIRKDLEDLRKAGAVKIDGSDVGDLAKVAELGVFEKVGREWEFSTENCTGTDLDASEL